MISLGFRPDGEVLGRPCSRACISSSWIRSKSCLLAISILLKLFSTSLDLCTSFCMRFIYSTDARNIVPLFQRTSRSLVLGIMVPSSLIRSLMLNLLLLSIRLWLSFFCLSLASARASESSRLMFRLAGQELLVIAIVGAFMPGPEYTSKWLLESGSVFDIWTGSMYPGTSS